MPGAATSMFGLELVPKIAFSLFKVLWSDPTSTESMQEAEHPEWWLVVWIQPVSISPLGVFAFRISVPF